MKLWRRLRAPKPPQTLSKFPGMPTLFMIVGCYNSGTTLLNHVLGTHPEISAFDTEGVALTKQFLTPEDFGWHRLWYKCRDKLEIQSLAVQPDPVQVRRDWGMYYDSRKPFALEKSIIHGLNIDWFEYHFDSPYFIWIVRNGYAVAEGIRRRTTSKSRAEFSPGQPYPIEWCAEQWVQSNQVIATKLQSVKHHYFLRYEDWMANPQLEIERLLTWLPVKQKQLVIPNSFTFHQETREICDYNKASLTDLSDKDLLRINKIAQEILLHFEYDVVDGDK